MDASIELQTTLSKINSPKDLRRAERKSLLLIASEIRKRILEVVSVNGGHLGGPLGAVELSIALHYCFNTPEDKLIWDTGHQSYAHKILTGRNKSFETLRKMNGISGFCDVLESKYDVFGAGHAGTSLSAALGIAKARDLKNENFIVVAVIGDGAMSSGLALEGLNNIGFEKSSMIVVLNDNGMSISPNVGALSNYFKDSMLQAHNGVIFEHMGFKYLGVVDGHNLDELIDTFEVAKKMSGPILIHIRTEKGKGYKFAGHDEDKLHGMSPFDTLTGKKLPTVSNISYTEVFSNTLMKIADADEKIVAITAAMKGGTGLTSFSRKYPQRFFDVGIAEQHAVTFAAGLAISGMKPVCAIYSTFLQRAIDQVIHDVGIHNLPVIFAIDRAGLAGEDGPTHQGAFDLAYLRMIPRMTIMVPKDENELQHMIYTSTFCNGPSAVRYPRGQGVGVELDKELKQLEIGNAEILREGSDVLIIAAGPVIYDALIACEETGCSATIVNARFIKPLDESAILNLAPRHKRVITIEEGTTKGGLGSAVAELLAQNNILKKITMLGLPDEFVIMGKQSEQKKWAKLDKDSIIEALNDS